MNNSESPLINDVSQISPSRIDVQENLLAQKEIFRTKRSYIPVELDKRQKLIQAVEEEGLTIKEAAQNLKINYSTAKHIVKVFKRTGEVQTQMMTKRMPERDIHQLEYLAFKPSQQLYQEQSIVRQTYPTDILSAQNNYKRLNLGENLGLPTQQQFMPMMQQQQQLSVPQLQSIFRPPLPQIQNLNYSIQNEPQVLKPIPMIRGPQQQQSIYQPQSQQYLFQPQQTNSLGNMNNFNYSQAPYMNQNYLDQSQGRQMLMLGLPPQNQLSNSYTLIGRNPLINFQYQNLLNN